MRSETKPKNRTKLPAIIVSNDPSNWMSCRIITPNLERVYREVFGENACYYSFTSTMTDLDVWKLSKELHAANPDRLVILDHMPHPHKLIRALVERYGHKSLPPIYVHVYGDFTLYTREWLGLEDILKSCRVKFICASMRQVDLVSRFLSSKAPEIELCPFPVDTSIFRQSSRLRKSWRKKRGISSNELVILYTGRLSLQKNIVRMSHEIADLSASAGMPLRLLLAGPFDDLGAPFFGIGLPRGFYYQHWTQWLESVNKKSTVKVEYLGNFCPDALVDFYNAADLYVSLSLHHDEDYGMSPAEALCCGTPVVLSDWGGYSSFANYSKDGGSSCSLVPVEITPSGLTISSVDFKKAIFQKLAGEEDASRKIARADNYAGQLSIGAVGQIVKKFHSTPPGIFSGFNWRMRHHAKLFNQGIPFPEGPVKDTFYEEIYGAYAGKALQ